MHDVRGWTTILQPQVPTAMGVGLVHAGHDRAGQFFGGHFDPDAARERLIALEIAGGGHLDLRLGPGFKGFVLVTPASQVGSPVSGTCCGCPSIDTGSSLPELSPRAA